MPSIHDLRKSVTVHGNSDNGKKYVVMQVTLTENLLKTGTGNLSVLEDVINEQADKGYSLHTISTTSISEGDRGLLGSAKKDNMRATMVFERID